MNPRAHGSKVPGLHYACSSSTSRDNRGSILLSCDDSQRFAKIGQPHRVFDAVGLPLFNGCAGLRACGAPCQNPTIYIPLGISSKEWDNPGCRKKRFFLEKQVVFPHGQHGLLRFLQKLPGSPFFRESTLRGNKNVFKFLPFTNAAVLHRPSLVPQMSQRVVKQIQ